MYVMTTETKSRSSLEVLPPCDYGCYTVLSSGLKALLKPKSWLALLRKLLIARPVKILVLVVLLISAIFTLTSSFRLRRNSQNTPEEEEAFHFQNEENWLLVAKPRAPLKYQPEGDVEPVAKWMLLNPKTENKSQQDKIQKNLLKE